MNNVVVVVVVVMPAFIAGITPTNYSVSYIVRNSQIDDAHKSITVMELQT